MHAEMDKIRLLDELRAGFSFVERTLALVPPDMRTQAGVQGIWSVKDIIAHLAAWQRRLLAWMAAANRGVVPKIPEPNYSWADVDILNERSYYDDRDRAYDDILDDFRSGCEEIVQMLSALSDSDLFTLRRYQGLFVEPPWELIAQDTYRHYDEHIPAVRAWINSIRATSEYPAVGDE